ncbi:MAG: hypothetical protein RQ856_06430 [Candidatus Izemoplasmatales bacterium]|nr:hypothetical protein [Candidatus Izemoplasmatales bacterium]
MRAIETKVYKFDELSEEAQQRAIENSFHFNVEPDWWEVVYEDADRIGLKITSFDIYKSHIEGEFIESAQDTIDKIKENHCVHCETYKTAIEYDGKLLIPDMYEDDEDNEFQDGFIENEGAAAEFLYSLLEDYLIKLRNEYEFQTSEENIKGSLIANEYEFTEDGEKV